MRRKVLTVILTTLLVLAQALPISAQAITTESSVDTEVSWTKPQSWEVTIPELAMDPTYATGTGIIQVRADLIDGNALTVTASPTVTMQQAGYPDVIADVTLSKTTWTGQEAAVTPVNSTVTVDARTHVHAGTYRGTLTYTVALVEE